MDSFTATNKILENLKVKYRHLDSIMNLTKEMEKAMLADDTGAFGRILDMRGDMMILADKVDQENREIVLHLPEPLRQRMETIIMPKKEYKGETMTLDNPLETNIYDTNKMISNLLAKIIKLDAEINEKVRNRSRASSLNMRG